MLPTGQNLELGKARIVEGHPPVTEGVREGRKSQHRFEGIRELPDSIIRLDLSLSACESRHTGSNHLIDTQIATARRTMALGQSLQPVIDTLDSELDDLLAIHEKAKEILNPDNKGWCEWIQHNTISVLSKGTEAVAFGTNAVQAFVTMTTDWISADFSVKIGGTLAAIQFGSGWVKANVLKDIEKKKARWIALNKLSIATIRRCHAEVAMFKLYELAVTGEPPPGMEKVIGLDDESGGEVDISEGEYSEVQGEFGGEVGHGARIRRSHSQQRPPSRKPNRVRRAASHSTPRARRSQVGSRTSSLRPRSLSPTTETLHPRRHGSVTDIDSDSEHDGGSGHFHAEREGRARIVRKSHSRSASPHSVNSVAAEAMQPAHSSTHDRTTRSSTREGRPLPPSLQARILEPISTERAHLVYEGGGLSGDEEKGIPDTGSGAAASHLRRRLTAININRESNADLLSGAGSRAKTQRRNRRTYTRRDPEDSRLQQFEAAARMAQKRCGGQITTLPLDQVMELFIEMRAQETGKSPLEMRFKPSTPIGKKLQAAAVNVHYRTSSANGSGQLSGAPAYPLQNPMARIASFMGPLQGTFPSAHSMASLPSRSRMQVSSNTSSSASKLSRKERKLLALRPDPATHPVWARAVARVQRRVIEGLDGAGEGSSSGTHARRRGLRRRVRHHSTSSDSSSHHSQPHRRGRRRERHHHQSAVASRTQSKQHITRNAGRTEAAASHLNEAGDEGAIQVVVVGSDGTRSTSPVPATSRSPSSRSSQIGSSSPVATFQSGDLSSGKVGEEGEQEGGGSSS